MATYLVTGCARGIGLELVTQLSQDPSIKRIIATGRKESPALHNVIGGSSGKVVFVELDVSSEQSVQKAVTEVERHVDCIDVLINNAGILNFAEGIEKMNDLTKHFEVNVLGVQVTTVAMLPLLKKGSQKKVVNISTTLGSIAMTERYAKMPCPAYKISKAALNMLTVQWALSYKDEGFMFLAVSPGWLKTDLGSQNADLSVQEGTKATIEVMNNNGPESTGKFLNIHVSGWENTDNMNYYDGKGVAW